MELESGGRQAVEIAVQKIGDTNMLKDEFKKIDTGNWNRPLAWSAWILFVISFFLPALGTAYGWTCAGLSATAITWPDFWHGNWETIHLALLTLANLVMIASPFLLPRFSRTTKSLKWLRLSHIAALLLVWSYVLHGLILMQKKSDLKIGCCLWTISFLLLCLSTLKIRGRKTTIAVAN